MATKELPPGSALTVDNVTDACYPRLSQRHSIALGTRLGLSAGKLEEINTQGSEVLSAVVVLWLETDPCPSWRQLICALDWITSHDPKRLADSIRQCAEPLKDPTLTSENVHKVMRKATKDFSALGTDLGVPKPVINRIEQEVPGFYSVASTRKRHCRLGDYWLSTLPDAGWARLARTFYVRDELAALDAVQEFLPEERDSTLTIDNLMGVLADVDDWDSLQYHLEVKLTNSVSVLMRWCPTETMRRRAVLNHWLQHHPVPSWGLVAMSLKKAGLQNLVQLVAAKYVIVEVRPLSELCKWALRGMVTHPSESIAENSHLSEKIKELPLPRHLKDYFLITRPGKPSFQPLEYGNEEPNDWFQTYVQREGVSRVYSKYGLICHQPAKK